MAFSCLPRQRVANGPLALGANSEGHYTGTPRSPYHRATTASVPGAYLLTGVTAHLQQLASRLQGILVREGKPQLPSLAPALPTVTEYSTFSSPPSHSVQSNQEAC